MVRRTLPTTDGDFNPGIHDPDGLTACLARIRATADLSVLRLGRGTLDDAAKQARAQKGTATTAYFHTLAIAQNALSDHLTGALFPLARDGTIEVKRNPAPVAEYRLIRYGPRTLPRTGASNDHTERGEISAGKIGAGHHR